ncbi:cupin-like domain-containing protein [uncultured Roseibium sp.]|uniref:cupin-like domain-containing protein n=1 Tax=uncultured Roseibium sp. TaxID=1936171 RepID=UPI00263A1E12|nr:cupin-like domain-containing protein [uncultured Roseibium sp.]
MAAESTIGTGATWLHAKKEALLQIDNSNSAGNTPPDVSSLHSRLFKLLSKGYENPYGLEGTLAVLIVDYPQLDSSIRFHPTHLEVSEMEAPNVDAELIFGVKTLARITQEYMILDWRDQSLISTIEARGRLDLVEHLGRCLLQPHPNTLYRYLDAQKRHFSRGFRMANAIERLTDLTHQKILTKMNWGFPFVMQCPSPSIYTQKWTLQRLVQYFGDAPVKPCSRRGALTLREFVLDKKCAGHKDANSTIFGLNASYTEGTTLSDSIKDVFGPAFFQRDDFLEPQLWLGSMDSDLPATSLHRDPYTSFLHQIMGLKRVDFYSSDQSIHLYPRRAHNNHQPCWFRPDRPDFRRLSKARKANKFSVVLQPGDVLVIPFGWFHQTHLLSSPNMSVSYRWKH